MAEEEKTAGEEEAPKKSGKMPLILNILVACSAIAAGFATPYLVAGGSDKDSKKAEDEHVAIPVDTDNLEFHEFGDATANIDDPNLSRFVKVTIAIAMKKEDKDEIVKLLEAKKIPLTDWLNGHLASQTMDSLRGKKGQDRLRREIKDQFNSMLFPDGVERIHGLYFNTFNVQ